MRILKYALAIVLILMVLFTGACGKKKPEAKKAEKPAPAPAPAAALAPEVPKVDAKTTAVYQKLSGEVDSAAIGARIRTLSSLPTRVSGYPSCDKAAEYVYSELEKAGVSDLKTETYPIAIPIDEGSWLETAGAKVRMHPLWPNLIRTSQLPLKGLDCPLIYAGNGLLPAFNGKDVAGSAVLLDFNCAGEWLNAPRLGAKAVIFIEPDITMRGEAESKFMGIPLAVPRFWVSKQDGEKLKALCANSAPMTKMTCRMNWQNRQARNVIGMIPGSDPKLKEQIIVLESFFDSMSVVPNLAPGAESACGVSAMIELAKIFKNNPPKRSILLIATSGHFEGLRGISGYFDKHFAELEAPGSSENFRAWWAKYYTVGIRYWLVGLILLTLWILYSAWLHKAPTPRMIAFGLVLLCIIGVFVYVPGPVNQKKIPQIYLFSGLDLTSRTKSVGIFYKGMFLDYREDIQGKFANVATMCWENAAKIGAVLNFDPKRRFADGVNPRDGRGWRNFIPGKIGLDSEMATLAGALGVSFVTTDDSREMVDTPFDTFDRINVENVADQVKMLACQYYHILNDPNQPKVPTDPKFPVTDAASFTRMGLQGGFGTMSGVVVEFDPRVSFIPKKPILDSLVIVRNGSKSFMGVRGNIVAGTTRRDVRIPSRDKVEVETRATFRIPGIPVVTAYGGGGHPTSMAAYKLNPDDGSIAYAPDLGISGAKPYPLNPEMTMGEKQISIVLFPCVATSIYDLVDQSALRALSTISIYEAVSNGEPRMYGVTMSNPEAWVSHVEDAAVIFSMPHTKMKIVMGAGPIANRFVLIGSTPKDPEGTGIDVGVGDVSNTALRVAEDLWNLDDFRIKRLARYRIINEGINELHVKAKEEITEANKALKLKDYADADAHARAGWGFEARAYPDVQATAQDVVKGVLFYMALLLPFSYFLERLIIGAADLRRQIIWAGGIFVGIFTIFRYVHPAFDITMNPLIVLLAFIMLALSIIVIGLIGSKFEEQLKQLNLQMSGVHKADIGRMSIAAAAFSLGISNMRRRKARTVLTCATLVLLTFTVLSFTSVVNVTRFNVVPSNGKPLYNGIMLRTAMWESLQEPAYRLLRDEFSKDRAVAPRAWFFGAALGEQSFLRLEKGDKKYDAKAAVGLTPEEMQVTHPERALITGRWFKPGDTHTVILPCESAMALGVMPQDVGKATVRFSGIEYTVIGLLRKQNTAKDIEDYKKRIVDTQKAMTDAAAKKDTPVDPKVVADQQYQLQMLPRYINYFQTAPKGIGLKMIQDLDQEVLTPVDFITMQKMQQQSKSVSEAGFREYTHMEPDNCFFVPYTTLLNIGGETRSIAISFASPKEVQMVLDKLMYRLGLNLYAGKGDKIFRYSSIAATSTSGMGTVLIPILIAALIVLNTMLGAVYERVREIGIFSSIGLAPGHIAMLFMAEALVYGVIGAVAGYLLGQGASKLITVFNLLPGLYLNFSSQSAVLSTGLVLATVMLSTIYPARKASEVATPALERSWKVPDPVGDLWKIDMPFSVTGVQAAGLNGFLAEWFKAYEEYSIGDFVTQNVESSEADTPEGMTYSIKLMTWLAPFDLGVSQQVVLNTIPTDMEDVFDLKLEIYRVSGDIANWKRVNRRFLNTMRKQFLIWRTLKTEERDRYLRGEVSPVGESAG